MKASLYANRPMDLTLLSDREFEEIVYHYFNEQIKNNLFSGMYDKAELSVGIGEGGADIKLYFNNKVVGCVQCKKYSGNVSDVIIMTDIVKLLLNHIDECLINKVKTSSFIHSIDTFTYYIVVAKDLTQKAKTLTSDFNGNWSVLNLGEIFETITSKYIKLKHIDFNGVEPELKHLLNNLKVETLNAVDIDKVIRTNVDIVQRYFAVEKVIDEEALSQIKNNLKTNHYLPEQIRQLASEASSSITDVKNHFGNKISLSIDRTEVNDIYQWIQKPLGETESNIAVISGNAGLGKSVIMLQLYTKLQKEEIPTICLKADRLAFNTIEELSSEIGLKTSFFQFMDQFVEIGNQVVLIIDQIDALSQTLSSNMKPLGMYDRIIKKYANYSNIRIIVSCRTYDLNYDPIINSYSNKKNFIIKPLDTNQVQQIIAGNINLKSIHLNEKLLELLRIPLHLDVFLKIFSEDLKISAIESIQDLYSELWKLKINNNKTGKNVNHREVVKLIFELALMMYEKQSISIPEDLFSDSFPQEIEYLSSEGIIIRKKNKIEFFHQTFFDYCIARNFVTSKKDLIEDIKSRHQGLFLRSKIQQILNYQRGTDPDEYTKDLNNILTDTEIRFHIKLLALQQLALQDSILIQEKKLVEKIYAENGNHKKIFISLYHGNGWLNVFFENGWIEQEVKSSNKDDVELIRSFLRRFSNRKSQELLDFLFNLKDSSIYNPLIQDLLWSIREYNDPRYMDLVEHILSEEGEQTLGYALYMFLEHGLKNYPDRVCKILLCLVHIDKSKRQIGEDDYFPGQNYHSQLYKDLWSQHPDYAYKLVKEIINEILENRVYEENTDKLKIDQAFLLYTKNEDHVYFHHKQLSKLQDHLIAKYNSDSEYVKREVLDYLTSKFVVHSIIAFSVIKEYPESFIEESFQFFSNDDGINNMVGINQYLNYLLQKSLGQSYSLYTNQQQEDINSMLMGLYPKYELRVIDYGDGKKGRNKSYGNTKYNFLLAIPELNRNTYPSLSKDFQELERKFGERKELTEPEGVKVSIGHNILTSTTYDKMSFEDWKNSFRKYNKNNPGYDYWNAPDEYAHGREFEKKVSENIELFLPLIDEIILDTNIPQSYKVKGISGLRKGLLNPQEVILRFVSAIKNNDFDDEQTMYLLWMTDYFTNSKIVNNDVFEFIKKTCLYGFEKKGDNDEPLTVGINSPRGAAVSALLDFHFSEEKRKEIYAILKLISNNSSPATRACVLYKLPNFLQYDEHEEILDIFYRIIKDYHPGLVKLSVNLLTYLINAKFEELKSFLKKSIYVEGSSKTLGHLLTKAYCFQYSGSEELLEEFWKLGDEQKEASIDIAWQFIKSNSQTEQALKVVTRFLDSESEVIAKAYIFPFFDLKVEQFDQLYEFLKLYVESNVGRHRQDSFYRYLLKCTSNKPEECIKLAKHFDNHLFEDLQKDRVLQNEPLQVIIQAYNSLREYDNDNPANESAMDAFDLILTKNEFRSGAFEVLEKVDLY